MNTKIGKLVVFLVILVLNIFALRRSLYKKKTFKDNIHRKFGEGSLFFSYTGIVLIVITILYSALK